MFQSREGKCKVKNCNRPIKARKLCDMHYARLLRTGSLELKTIPRGSIDTCLVIGCDKPHKSHGYCHTHTKYYQQNGTLYKPKIIKLCGVRGCEEIHFGRGLCKDHFYEWKKNLKKYGLDQTNS